MRKGFGVFCMLLGLVMIGCAGWLILENRAEEIEAGESVAQVLEVMTEAAHSESLPPVEKASVKETQPPMGKPAQEPEMSVDEHRIETALDSEPTGEMPTMTIDGNEYIGYLELPTISLVLPVMSEWSYPQLRVAPCRYQGSAYDDTLVIMAHNYEHHFGRLTSLQIGDPVQFVDAQGNIFRYVVGQHELLEKNDVEKMIVNEWDLTLFSCTYGGGSRVTVRLKRVLAYT